MTNSTADAAKLRQIQIAHVIADCDGTDCLSRAKTIMNMVENTRPQPAPPEGEPSLNFVQLTDEYFDSLPDHFALRPAMCVFGMRMYRLGLTARPKVEDAEVARVVANMRGRLGAMSQQPDKECNETADLLERLAGDLQNWWSAAIVAMKAQEAAEAKLAERDAELAKADAVIWLLVNEGTSSGSDEEDWKQQSYNRHAARQQQKGKPEDMPCTKDGGFSP